METPHLPARLRAALALVPVGSAVADIGAGHGALAVNIAARDGARVIATEALPGPLAELRSNLALWGAAERVEVRSGRGLEPFSADEVDGAVIAGMGARTLLSACEDAGRRGLRWLVLQPMQGEELVEPVLTQRGWRVVERLDVAQRRRRYSTWLVEVTPS